MRIPHSQPLSLRRCHCFQAKKYVKHHDIAIPKRRLMIRTKLLVRTEYKTWARAGIVSGNTCIVGILKVQVKMEMERMQKTTAGGLSDGN